ncbi:phosphopantetheine-binding protein [Streptomyces sp. NBC_00435]|uniref:phosphopantetheine-binding protein n=1 Tax=Streptomyces sp. NBC_00435 TaxID=2903649 RepID=UPI002E1F05DF
MSMDVQALAVIRQMVADLAGRPVEEIQPGDRLLEDLDLDSLQITELAQKIENTVGRPVDEDLLNAEGTTVADCVEIATA